MKMRDVWVAAKEWAGVHVVVAQSEPPEDCPPEYSLHVMMDDGAHGLMFAEGETLVEAVEELARQWEELARQLRRSIV